MTEKGETQVDTKNVSSSLDNPIVQAGIVMAAVIAFILILAWRLGGLKDFEPGEYQEPTPLVRVLKEPENYLSKEEIKISGLLKEATDSADFILVQNHDEILVKPESGIHAEDFINRGEIGVGGKLEKEENGDLVLKAVSFEVIDLEADAARARAVLMADKIKPTLADTLEMDPETIKVRDAVELDWPNTSLGAAEPGKSYAQVLTKGYKIIYESNGNNYEVHTDREGTRAILIDPRIELPVGRSDQQDDAST